MYSSGHLITHKKDALVSAGKSLQTNVYKIPHILRKEKQTNIRVLFQSNIPGDENLLTLTSAGYIVHMLDVQNRTLFLSIRGY